MPKPPLILWLALIAAPVLAAARELPFAATVSAAAPDSAATRTEAAQAFLATLSDAQRKAVLFHFDDDAQRRRWSNFPTGVVPRAGVKWGDLDGRQRLALMALLGTILSPDGVRMVREQMAADEVLRTTPGATGPGGRRGPPRGGAERGPPPGGFPGGPPPGGGPGGFGGFGGPPPGFAGSPGERPDLGRGPGGPGERGGGSPDFGSAFYYVSILGTPSATQPWLFQFGGHHLAINATVKGQRVTLSPTLTGGEPLRFNQDGKRVYIVEKEVTAAAALLASLSPVQRGRAVVSSQHIDLVLGPGHDGQVLQPEGLAGAAMSPEQKRLFLELIEARLGIEEPTSRSTALAAILADLDKTWFAWFGPATPLGDAYFRVTGPTVLIEYSPQDMDGDATDHAHNMYRDPINEYGAKWTAAR